MARKRDIDPSLWDHEELNALPIPARYLFIGIVSNADDEGRLKGAPRYLKRLVFSYDEGVTVDQVRDWRDQLVGQQHLCLFEYGLDTYVHLPSWHRWQAINRQMVSKIPPCPVHGPCPRHEADREDVSDHDPFSEYAVNGHAALSDDATTTGPDRTGPVPDRTGTGTATGPEPGAAATPPTRPGSPKEAPPQERFRTFHGYLSGLKGYAPNVAFWGWMEKHASELDLDAEASKILDFLRRHPNRNCNARFLHNWLNGAVADQKGVAVNEALARGRQNGIARAAVERGTFHRTCGTHHQDWDVCPADVDDQPHPEAV